MEWQQIQKILDDANDAALADPDSPPDFKVLDELSDNVKRAGRKREALSSEVAELESQLDAERSRLKEVATITTSDELGTVFESLGKPREYGELFMSVVDLPAGSAVGVKEIKAFLDEIEEGS